MTDPLRERARAVATELFRVIPHMNSGIDARDGIADNAPDAAVVLGFDWTEHHRAERARRAWSPRRVRAPLLEPPYLERDDMLEVIRASGLVPPRLYAWGLAHNNCGGFCIKSGISHFVQLHHANPTRFAEFERKEAEVAAHIGKPVSVLKDRRGGETRPMSLSKLRERIEAGELLPKFDLGGCGCFDED